MTTIQETDVALQWQTFSVVGGVISRNAAGQVEGILELGQGAVFTFTCDPDGSHWTWLPEEPNFVSDESGDYASGDTAH
jgi:hypothetical protein